MEQQQQLYEQEHTEEVLTRIRNWHDWPKSPEAVRGAEYDNTQAARVNAA